MSVSLVVTVIGPDRPGLVSLLSDRGRAHGASWAESRMASLAGQFAGIVHFSVPAQNAEALAAALRELSAMDLAIAIAESRGAATRADDRMLALSSFGFDLSVYDVFGILASGGTIVLPTDAQVCDPAAWASLIRRHGVTIWNTVPALMEMMVTYAEASEDDALDAAAIEAGTD